MASKYFTLPSFTRAQRNREELEKTNPQKPVLNDEDEKFLERHLSQDEPSKGLEDIAPSKITEDGVEKTASPEEAENATPNPDQLAVPEKQPEAPEATLSSPTTKKKRKEIELPSQEEAEAATRNFNIDHTPAPADKSQLGTRSWTSYLPSIPTTSSKKGKDSAPDAFQDAAHDASQDTAKDTTDSSSTKDQRTWAEYAQSYIPASLKPKQPDSSPEPVYNPDGTINEVETAKLQEREVSVLLDQLNMSSINNRVFSFSAETQQTYDRFAQCLKDTMNGVPTAYDDMETLMKEAGPTLEKQFKAMPPFVQTLVKSLPAKLGTTLAPELLAAASEKPGEDLKRRMDAAGEQKGKGAAAGAATGKKKRTVPGLKKLISQEGAVATILRNVVSFIKVRFPFLASTTNVVMSLAVFILMFVFWYCHKRGKETRLAREAEDTEKNSADDDENSVTAEGSSDEDGEDDGNSKSDILNQPHPAEVPLPEEKEAEKV